MAITSHQDDTAVYIVIFVELFDTLRLAVLVWILSARIFERKVTRPFMDKMGNWAVIVEITCEVVFEKLIGVRAFPIVHVMFIPTNEQEASKAASKHFVSDGIRR